MKYDLNTKEKNIPSLNITGVSVEEWTITKLNWILQTQKWNT